MHRALKIPEVIRLIIGQLFVEEEDEDEQPIITGIPDALAAVLTCKAFFDAGISLVWQSQDSLQLDSLAKGLLKWNNEDLAQQKQFPLAARRERFQFYASFVTDLHWEPLDHRRAAVSLERMRVLSPPNAPYIFSCLRSLDTNATNSQDLVTISSLLCPSLESFSVFKRRSNPDEMSVASVSCLLDAISRASPSLRRLMLLGFSSSLRQAHAQALNWTITLLTKLEHLSFDGGLYEPLKALVHCSNLSSLHLRISDENLPTEALFRSTPNLKSFSIASCRRTRVFLSEELLALCTGVAQCPHLLRLYITLYFEGVGHPPVSWAVFSPLSQCTDLEACHIRCQTGSPLHLEDSHIKELTKDMRCLRTLFIFWLAGSSVEGKRLTTASLRYMAENCPLIEEIRIDDLDLNALVPPPRMPPSVIPLHLHLQKASADSPYLVGTFLA